MNIIKMRQLPQTKIYRKTCNYCQTIFEFTRGEAIVHDSHREGTWLETDCPLCKKPVYEYKP